MADVGWIGERWGLTAYPSLYEWCCRCKEKKIQISLTWDENEKR